MYGPLWFFFRCPWSPYHGFWLHPSQSLQNCTFVLFQVKSSALVESVIIESSSSLPSLKSSSTYMLKPFSFYRLNKHSWNPIFVFFFPYILQMCFHCQNNNLFKNMWYAGISITWLNHILFYLRESNLKTYSENKHNFFIKNMYLTCCHIFLFFFLKKNKYYYYYFHSIIKNRSIIFLSLKQVISIIPAHWSNVALYIMYNLQNRM